MSNKVKGPDILTFEDLNLKTAVNSPKNKISWSGDDFVLKTPSLNRKIRFIGWCSAQYLQTIGKASYFDFVQSVKEVFSHNCTKSRL